MAHKKAQQSPRQVNISSNLHWKSVEFSIKIYFNNIQFINESKIQAFKS